MTNVDHLHGVHYYADLSGCLRRAHLEGDDDSSEAADYGTEIHAWLKAYHCGEAVPTLKDDKIDRSCSQSEMAERYARRFAPSFLGTTLMAEERLHGTVDGGDGRVYPLAGTLDRVHRLGVSDVVAFEHDHGILLEPGIYLSDFKTSKQHTTLTVPRILASDQSTAYTELLEQNHPEWMPEFKGTLFHLLYRYVKETPEQFRAVFVGLPSEEDRARLRALIRDGVERLERYGPDHVTPTRCFDWMKLCPLWGACSRMNDVKES